MNYGLYTAYLGMRARMRTLDVIANNLANASTNGFKADRLYYRSVEAAELDADYLAGMQADAASAQSAPAGSGGSPEPDQADQSAEIIQTLLPSRALGVTTGGLMDFSIGSVRQTGRSLDVALAGDGF